MCSSAPTAASSYAQAQKQIGATDAAALTGDAREVRDSLGCASS
jgi:hypothetical protein